MSETWVSAVAAVIVATLGVVATLGGGWSTRRSLRDELDLAERIQEVYPEDNALQRKIHERIAWRLAAIDLWTPHLLTMRFFALAFAMLPILFGVKFLEYWLRDRGLSSVIVDQLSLLRRAGLVFDLMIALFGIVFLIASLPMIKSRLRESKTSDEDLTRSPTSPSTANESQD